eukprot:CAMPEP_0197665816 /NCGR_PEP_ID=MMETSP1338-20131121/60577_1 /TAXON_ID=43686 ORGANISM="Pelagodinium beii, Strain RCC1491" /NCGR_SAMPLE_ID=MMETSP1338 /ASSEMBLY_ACC=CAM_ASM_000754 /LENGTH=104 /DNA_ID=CAMNT_0043244725 /DNA_START=597 /DNA_END=911 /DNA_ORIENTATION=-
MYAACVLVNVRVIQPDEEVTFGDAEKSVNFIDELVSLGLVFYSDNLHRKGHACGFVYGSAYHATGTTPEKIRLIHFDVDSTVPKTALADENPRGSMLQRSILAH